jgi:TRAP transporter TAXI family solute receptor
MKINITAAALAATLAIASTANADTVGIAASKKGSLYDRSGTAIAKVVTNKGGMQATLRNYDSPNVYIPAMNKGQIEFGLVNEYELEIAVKGQGHFEGRPHPNLRAVVIMYPLRTGLFVRADSDIKTVADLKGKRIPDGYVAQKIILRLMDAVFATAGLTRDDMVGVPVASVVTGANAFIAGKTDFFLFALGGPKVREANAKIGIRALPIDNTPANLAAIQKHMPVAYFKREKPGKHNPGVTQEIWSMTYDALVIAHEGSSEDDVYNLVKAMHANKPDLAKAFPVFNLFNPKRMAKALPGIEWHPGAVRFYKEQGLWPPK